MLRTWRVLEYIYWIEKRLTSLEAKIGAVSGIIS